MEPIFTLPFSEYEAINELKGKLKSGCSFYVPTSRQQKGIDFLIHNDKKNKFLRIQVKSSRSYISDSRERKDKRKIYKYHFWFNNFIDKYKPGNADYYFLFGLYPEYETKDNIKSRREFLKTMIICFSEKEMFSLLKKIRMTKNNKIDRFFDISFDVPGQIYGSRGFDKNIDLSKFLLDNKLTELKKKLNV